MNAVGTPESGYLRFFFAATLTFVPAELQTCEYYNGLIHLFWAVFQDK